DTDLAAPDRPQTLDEPGAADAIGKPAQQEQDLGMPSGQGDLPAVRTPQGGFGAEDDAFASGRLGVGSKHSLRSVELGQLRTGDLRSRGLQRKYDRAHSIVPSGADDD